MVKALTLVAALTLGACATSPEPANDPRRVWCDHNRPRRDATPDTPREEIDEINAHNRRGEVWCGWMP